VDIVQCRGISQAVISVVSQRRSGETWEGRWGRGRREKGGEKKGGGKGSVRNPG